MKTFNNLYKLIRATANKAQAQTIDRLINSEYADQVLRNHSTETRWTQYTAGTITRDQAVNYATKRIVKEWDKWTQKHTARLDTAAQAAEITNFTIYIKWTRSSTWGHNPQVTVYAQNTNNETIVTTGTASGCGYDKMSAAICDALNKIPGLLKGLYTVKENAITAGTTPTTEINESNKKYICYGAGYGALPYFEGGCGINCTLDCLELCGYTVKNYRDEMITGFLK